MRSAARVLAPRGALLLLVCAAKLSCTQISADDARLDTRLVRGDVEGIQHRTYRITLNAGESVRVIVDQHEADLVLTITGGVKARTIDMREFGVESATIVAEAQADFLIALHAKNPQSARVPYDVSVDATPHPATLSDRQWRDAEDQETEAKRLTTENPLVPANEAALVPLAAALDTWRRVDNRLGQATVLARTGDIHDFHGRFTEAEEAYRAALDLSRELGLLHLATQIRNNLGVGRGHRGLLREAKLSLLQALVSWSLLSGVDAEVATTLTNHGAVLFESGDYQEAVERFLSAQAIFEKLNDPRAAAALNNIGLTQRALGDLDAAQQSLDRATQVPLDSVPPSLQTIARRARSRALIRRGQVALERGYPRTADASARGALESISQAGDPITEADALDLRGQVADAAGSYDAALAFYGQALGRYRVARARRGVATALHHAAVAHRRLGQYALARAALTEALEIRGEVGLRDAEAETLFEVGQLEHELRKFGDARRHLGAALDIVEDVRGRVAGEYSRTSFFAARQKYFAAYIDLLMEMHAGAPSAGYAAEAFKVAEQERSRALIDAVRDARTDLRRTVDPALLELEREVQRQLDFWSAQLARLADRHGSEQAAGDVRRKVDAYLQDYRQIESRVDAAARAHDAEPIDPPILGISDIQQQVLTDDSLLVRFSLGERQSHVWLLSRNASTLVTLKKGKADIDAAAREVADLVGMPRTRENAPAIIARFNDAATRLSGILLEPLAAELGMRRLVIVAEGALQRVPFAALPEPGTGLPLVARHEIVMWPSASAVAIIRQRTAGRTRPSKTVAVIADPVYEPDDPRIASGATRPTVNAGARASATGLSRLAISKAEGQWIVDNAPGERFIAFSFDANREVVLGPQVADSRIIHFAGHALVDSLRPELSSIAVTQFDPGGKPRDGLIRLHTIATNLSLRAELVVLSACDSAVGKDVAGEGPMGLARGFFAAGAGAVVGTMYKVQEAPTFELMRTFYRELFSSEPWSPARALRAAQNQMRARPEYTDPLYWAGFVVMGDSR